MASTTTANNKSKQPPPKDSTSTMTETAFSIIWKLLAVYAVLIIGKVAYQIRLRAIEDFGPVIHEFDPYFNYRATEYLYEHGAAKFFTWFDHMSWYPLGRPVGTTIYPGMQFTAVYLKQYLPLLQDWSLNDICCYIPAWFGVVASILVGLMTYEASLPVNTQYSLLQWILSAIQGVYQDVDMATAQAESNWNSRGGMSQAMKCGLFGMAMMAIVPAHLTRSMGGGYDNESIAVSAMCLTFYCWMRSLRATHGAAMATLWGTLTGLAYFYMVAAWGGYIFVLNVIGVHCAVLVGLGRFSNRVYAAYSMFYLVGTSLAIQVPVVGWAPLKSLEQLGPCAVFLGVQALQFCEVVRKRQQLTRQQAWALRFKVAAVGVAAVMFFVVFLTPAGYFGPLSSRVRGLFVQHTRTGNPLVDSVAEHQPASTRAYFQYLHHVCTLAPAGFLLILMGNMSDTSSFLAVWGVTSYFFSHKMVRLILLTAPIASTCGGIAAGRIVHYCLTQLWGGETVTKPEPSGDDKPQKKGKKPSKQASTFDDLGEMNKAVGSFLETGTGSFMKQIVCVMILAIGYSMSRSFMSYCWRLSKDLSNPSIVVVGRIGNGQVIKVDDYREAYWWLRDNTPEDARVMAWWDYGYQISALSNRTTLADGNTWNHEHIALLAVALTAPIEEGHEIARHLADYVLVWAGGGGDDVAKSPHLARIATSVYRDHCGGETTCQSFGFKGRRGASYEPTEMMEKSLLYKLHSHERTEGVDVDPKLFKEVYTSKYGKVRIYKVQNVSQESRAWVADPANRKCDVEGSWFCPGQYPPALIPILNRKKDFAQLEDFNRGHDDEEYRRKYHEELNARAGRQTIKKKSKPKNEL